MWPFARWDGEMVFRWARLKDPAAIGRTEPSSSSCFLLRRWTALSAAQGAVVHEEAPQEVSSFPDGALARLKQGCPSYNASDVQPDSVMAAIVVAG
jgi:hypothetical protein